MRSSKGSAGKPPVTRSSSRTTVRASSARPAATARPATVDAYLQTLPPDRRAMIAAVRRVVLDHLPNGYAELLDWGITYAIPLEQYPNTYNGHPLAIAAICSQKNYCTLHLMGAYGDVQTRAWLEAEFSRRGKTLDMGKACLHFRSLDDLPLDVIGQVIARIPPDRYIARYEASRRK
jgi:hypothetical protein